MTLRRCSVDALVELRCPRKHRQKTGLDTLPGRSPSISRVASMANKCQEACSYRRASTGSRTCHPAIVWIHGIPASDSKLSWLASFPATRMYYSVSAYSLIWRKLGTRKSRLETKTENEAFSALLARLWCHLIPQTPPTARKISRVSAVPQLARLGGGWGSLELSGLRWKP